MRPNERIARDLIAYLAGDEDVWDGYGVAEVATILEPLAYFYLSNMGYASIPQETSSDRSQTPR